MLYCKLLYCHSQNPVNLILYELFVVCLSDTYKVFFSFIFLNYLVYPGSVLIKTLFNENNLNELQFICYLFKIRS